MEDFNQMNLIGSGAVETSEEEGYVNGDGCTEVESEIAEALSEEPGSYIADNFQLYLTEIGRVKTLSLEEERELGRIISEGGKGSLEARNKLVEANLRLVVFYAKKYMKDGYSLDDLNAMGYCGLIRAAEKYDYRSENRFSTYASWWIKQAITRGIAENYGTIKVPIHMKKVIHDVKEAQAAIGKQKEAAATIEEISEYTGYDVEKVRDAFSAMRAVISYEVTVGDNDDTTLGELIADENTVDPCDMAVQSGLKSAVGNVLSYLAPNEARVLKLRYGIGGGRAMTLEEIAKLPEFKVTRERIRQIENRAFEKIRRSPSMCRQLKEYAS